MALNFPTLLKKAPTSGCLSLYFNTQTFESPLNGTIQTMELPGARWKAAFDFNNLREADIRTIKAFLAQLRGAAGRFYLYDFSHKTPSGTAAGTPLVKGSAQTGATLLTDGWTANQSNLLLPGDYIGVNGELKIITAIASSDSGGNATLTFSPPLRQAPADNAAITTTRPTAIFRLDDDKQDQLVMVTNRIANFRLNATEVF